MVLKVQPDLLYKVLAALRLELLVVTLDAVFLKTDTAPQVLLRVDLQVLASVLVLTLQSALHLNLQKVLKELVQLVLLLVVLLPLKIWQIA